MPSTKLLKSSDNKYLKSAGGKYILPAVQIVLDHFTLPSDLTELYIRQGGTLYRVDDNSKQ